ncbi:hypothetical protein IYW40_07275 [Methylocystis sp. H4A]|uniref:hypothetical protein n=1 Tax=Methylocystis sp. H4A TaxID=2785788 RepID=UPI0018C2EA70|nr:hypothetical protein [Methylocystis sp. H4A]MBG0801281.1 hypothetical protein [Methylocystis sp. H4A]
MTDTATRPTIEPAVDEAIVVNRMFAAAFECALYERLAPFQRRALEAAMNADDDGEVNALAEIAHKHRRNAWLATDGAFKIDADRTFNDCAQAAVLEVKAAIGDDEDDVRSPRAAKED